MRPEENLPSVLSGIWAGYSFRSKLSHTPGGNAHVLQMKDLEDHYSRVGTSLTCIRTDTVPDKFLLHAGDVLFLAKGANNYALAYTPVLPRVIPASAFFILRPNLQKVDPGYLAWYINQAPVQQYLKAHAVGKHTPNINKDVLARITLPVPPLARQQTIAAIDRLRREEMLLLRTIQARRAELIARQLLTAVSTPAADGPRP
ncbi:restriction endonuclease subunit S [Dawidia soli]|uniref:Restriction endonuclease subunit S n=1 Tax=Dawidia soli TaxID=2782352 RepID=A0AAP2DG46_9BACT|nr:restriction endonuclease subunit S [Dawidia soli]MBT1690165.1 restriction endonuclease subunit S [Dawidia soli]